MVFVRLWVLASHFCLIVGSHLLLDDSVAMDYAVYLYNQESVVSNERFNSMKSVTRVTLEWTVIS